MSELVRVEGLEKRFGSVPVLRGVDLTVGEGEFVAIVGRSGSGKSTLLHLMAGLDTPDSGQILYRGRSMVGLGEDELALWRRRQVGLVFQSFHLVGTLSAVQNVAFPLYPERMAAAERQRRALQWLEQVGLADRAGHLPSQLSGGQQQRVAIARALVGSPGLVLADEPTGNLDSQTGGEILALFRRLRAQHGIALVIVTHDEQVAAAADRVVRMEDGGVLHEHAGD
jgi:predicted ABC-type transport system involved in lysophospholipase L1 biosynthesis ATPase subunit